MISKELLSAVFTDEQQDFKVVGICPEDEILLEYVWIEELPEWDRSGYATREVKMTINIHELAHKCKEWARSKGFILWSTVYGFECYIDGRRFTDFQDIRFMADTEPEAVFKACEWIMENK